LSDLFKREHAVEPLDGDKGREERGAFYTPDALAKAICGSIDWLVMESHESPCRILEPGCGGGAFLRAAWEQWAPEPDRMLGVDLEPACSGPGRVEKRDLFTVTDKFDLILGNPDYAIAERAVRHCLGLLDHDGYLTFLLRAAFLGSSGRVGLYRDFPLRYFQPIAQRPSFTADGKTDPMEYGLFVWQRGFHGRGEILQPLVWR
jgi:hypothetical protein